MDSMAFLLLANSSPEVDKNQKMELIIESLNFYIGSLGLTRLSDSTESGPSASNGNTVTVLGSSVGSSSKVNSSVSLAATDNTQEKIKELDEVRMEPNTEGSANKSCDSQKDLATESSGVSRITHQLCIIITKAADKNNEENDAKVNKTKSNGKKEKEKVHVSIGEWKLIMTAVNHGTEVPTNSRREVLMGYQYAIHQHRKKLREEEEELRRSQESKNASSEEYWDE
jgi:hypothetical protein